MYFFKNIVKNRPISIVVARKQNSEPDRIQKKQERSQEIIKNEFSYDFYSFLIKKI